jgi:hypothetical protein
METMASEINKDLVFSVTEETEKRDYLELIGKFHFRPTLFVGVGGTGAQAVEKVKRLFLSYVRPQMQKNQTAMTADIDPMYSFLAFDTNKGEKKELLTENREWFHLGVSDMAEFYRGLGQTPFFKNWLVQDYPVHSLDSGAGGYRNLGRLAFLANVEKVQRAVGQSIHQIMTAAANLKAQDQVPNVHVFCSLSGGTGSGMLLDLCFLLRRMLPQQHKIIGHIAVLHGLPSVPEIKKRDVQVNTFVALKELNAFMTGRHEGVAKGLCNYPYGVTVQVDRPLDECYLVGSHRNDGAISLPTQKHVSSFMARLAFMMAAYSFAGDEPDYAGIIINHANVFTKKASGARTCYVVPGFAQVHFPVDKVADLFVLETARAFVHFQCEGSSTDADAGALEFLKSENLEFGQLKQRVSKKPGDAKNLPLAPQVYDDQIKALLGDSSRYQKREEVLAYGQKMPAGRLRDFQALLQPNLDAIYNDCWPKILATVRDLFERSDKLGRGTLRFVNSLAHLLRQERDYLAALDKKQIQQAYDSIPQNWQTVQPIVTDVVTDDGFVDRRLDSLKLPKTEALYVTFLNDAEATTLERAKNELTAGLIERICSSLDSLAKTIKELVEINLPAAAKLIEKKILEINTELYNQTEGTDDSVFNICSVNAMTQEWRQDYLAHKGLVPAQVLANLIPKAGAESATPAWRPSDLLFPQDTGGMELSHYIAQTIVSRVNPLLEETRHWSPEEVLSMTETVGRQKPEDIIGGIYNKNVQPQLQITAMKNRAATAPYNLVFCGGITDKLKTWLTKSEQLQGVVLNVADNQETHRINYASATLPVALAGCDLIVDVLGPEYKNWWEVRLPSMDKDDREQEKALFHCYPGSAKWASPILVHLGFDAVKDIFAKALAISEMLEVSEPDAQRMQTASPTPREKRYGLFQVGGAQFWLWPFFEPNNQSSPIKDKLKRLGSNILDAYGSFETDADCQRHAQDWVNWFAEKWDGIFLSTELADRVAVARKSFEARKAKTDEPGQVEIWDTFLEILADWKIAKN